MITAPELTISRHIGVWLDKIDLFDVFLYIFMMINLKLVGPVLMHDGCLLNMATVLVRVRIPTQVLR